MKAVLIIIILFVTHAQAAFCQSLELKQVEDQLIILNTGDLKLVYLPADQFQNLDWERGYAYYLDGSSRAFDGMKYDPQFERIEVNTAGNILTLLPGVINGVSMEKGGAVTRIFLKVPLKEPVFMEALSIGKVHLLIYRKTKQEEMDMYVETDATNIIVEKEDPIIEFEEILYIWNKKGAVKFKNSSKSLIALMDDKEEEIKVFLDANKIRIKNISDLMEVFDYYNNI